MISHKKQRYTLAKKFRIVFWEHINRTVFWRKKLSKTRFLYSKYCLKQRRRIARVQLQMTLAQKIRSIISFMRIRRKKLLRKRSRHFLRNAFIKKRPLLCEMSLTQIKRFSLLRYKTNEKNLIRYLRITYGHLRHHFCKSFLSKIIKQNKAINPILFFESRLDALLIRLRFATTIPTARRLILKKQVCVNSKIITKIHYLTKPGDFITFAFTKTKLKHTIQKITCLHHMKKIRFFTRQALVSCPITFSFCRPLFTMLHLPYLLSTSGFSFSPLNQKFN